MITVPQGGSSAGRSADIRGLDQQPDMGGFISQVGSAVAQKMGQIDQEQRAVRMSRAKIEMTKALGQEYQRVSQLGDPAAIDAEWPQVEARVRDEYINRKDENGRPVWRPDEADALGLYAMDLSQRQALALGERNIALQQSRQAADWLETRADLTTSAATADPVTMETLLQEGYARIDAQVAAGLMLPDKGVTEKQGLQSEVMNARLITAIDQDPAAAAAALDAGTYDALGPEAVAQRRATAQAEVDRRAAAGAKQAEADAKVRNDAIGKRLDTIGELTAAGRKVADVDFVLNAPDEIKANPKYPRALARVKLGQEIPNLDVMTPAELDALIAAEKNREIVEDWEAERLPALIEMRDRKATALATDPKSALTEAGVIPETDLSFDPANPGAFAAGLQEALSYDAFQREKGYSDQSAIFTKDQKAGLKAVLAPGADADAKYALATAILQGTGGNAAPVLSALEADPTFRRTVKVLGLTGDSEMASSILRGQQKAEVDTVLKLPRAEQIRIFNEVSGGVFSDQPVAIQDELMSAAAALYADGAQGIDPAIQPAEAYALYKQAFIRLLGAQPDRNGAYTIGGLQEVNGVLTVLPVGMSAQAVEDAWDSLADQLYENPTDPASVPMGVFKSASVYGGVPDLGTDPYGRLSTLSLRRVGETDIYELVREQNGRIMPIREVGRDNAYRFRLKDLVRGGSQ